MLRSMLYAMSVTVPVRIRQATMMAIAAIDMNPCLKMLRRPSFQ